MVIPSSLIERLQTHHLLILGLGREGLSSYRFLRQLRPSQPILLLDDQPLSQLNPVWLEILEHDSALQFRTTDQITAFEPQTLVFKTPGWPPTHRLMELVRAQQIATISNTQVFFEVVATNRLTLDGQVALVTIGVTGTKGKSTTTSLIHHVLQQAGLPALVGGNLGVPALDLLPELAHFPPTGPVYVVLELSCHQLDDLTYSPDMAVIQNIVPEHLDFYHTFERYVAAKSQITRYQTGDSYVIFNPSLAVPNQLATLSPGHKIGFLTSITPDDQDLAETASNPEVSIVAYRTPEWIMYQGEPLMSISDLPLLGQHNLENTMPAIVIGKACGLASSEVVAAIKSFRPLAHRLELVAEHQGVSYYNDSLSTVPEAAMAAIQAMNHRPMILIAGGYDRGLAYGELADHILQSSVKALIAFPPTGDRLIEELHTRGGHGLPVYRVESMAQAVHIAHQLAQSGDAVLLSPASASFGRFKDYQDRGQQFTQLVRELLT